MKISILGMPVAAVLLLAGPAIAQSDDEAAAREAAAVTREVEAREEEVARRLREAEARMAEAARQIAELTSERLPQIHRIERRLELVDSGRPRLGVTIGNDDAGPVEGVRVMGVTPGSAASEAGLRAGDILTSVNGETLSAENADAANEKLLDFMDGVEEGDTIDVQYLRDGKVGQVEVEPQVVEMNMFAFLGEGMPRGAPGVHVMPDISRDVKRHLLFDWSRAGWGDMELVELNEGLGRYFGTDDGLLVVRAPTAGTLKLEDGDVIQKIDGRTPSSVRHAMRILGSYQAGEKLTLDIMRDKKRRSLDVEIPDDRSSMLLPGMAPEARPAAAPVVPRLAAPIERT
jgi:S1-C subfamily serine protease